MHFLKAYLLPVHMRDSFQVNCTYMLRKRIKKKCGQLPCFWSLYGSVTKRIIENSIFTYFYLFLTIFFYHSEISLSISQLLYNFCSNLCKVMQIYEDYYG